MTDERLTFEEAMRRPLIEVEGRRSHRAGWESMVNLQWLTLRELRTEFSFRAVPVTACRHPSRADNGRCHTCGAGSRP